MSHINKLFGGVKVQRALFLFFLEAKQWHRTGRHAARRVSAPLAPEISVTVITRSQPQSRPASSLDTEPSRRSVLAAKFPGTSSRIWSGLAQIRLFFFGGRSYGPCRSTTTTSPEFTRKKETATAFEWMTPTTRTMMSWTNL